MINLEWVRHLETGNIFVRVRDPDTGRFYLHNGKFLSEGGGCSNWELIEEDEVTPEAFFEMAWIFLEYE